MANDNQNQDELTEEDLTLGGVSTLNIGKKGTPNPGDEEEEDDSLNQENDSLAKEKQNFVTREGLKQLKAELKELEEIILPKVIQQLKEAISLGDLSENAEYENSKNEQAVTVKRITELKQMIKTAKIITIGSKSSSETVRLGSTVKIKNLTDNDKPETFTIVGSIEADATNAKISNESPIGAAIMEHMTGEKVEVSTPAGKFTYKILAIS